MPTTAAPAISRPLTVSPTLPPLTATDTEVNVVLSLRNTANRNMTEQEEDDFVYELLEFYFIHAYDFLRVKFAQVWYQQKIDWVDDTRKLRGLQGLSSQELVTNAVTVILQVTYFGAYPEEDISAAVTFIIKENEEDLVISLRGKGTTYFMQLDAIQVKTIEQATYAPIASPNTLTENTKQGSNAGGMFISLPNYFNVNVFHY